MWTDLAVRDLKEAMLSFFTWFRRHCSSRLEPVRTWVTLPSFSVRFSKVQSWQMVKHLRKAS